MGDARAGDYTGIRRRVTPVLATLLLAFTVSGARAQPAMDTPAMTASCPLYLVRHAEKQTIAGEKDPPLTAQGEARARALVAALASRPLEQVYATDYRRTQATVAPVAAARGLTVQRYDARRSGDFLTQLLAQGCPNGVLIAGHSNTLPELLRAAGIAETASEFDESRYGELFIVERTQTTTGWQATLRVERFGDSQ